MVENSFMNVVPLERFIYFLSDIFSIPKSSTNVYFGNKRSCNFGYAGSQRLAGEAKTGLHSGRTNVCKVGDKFDNSSEMLVLTMITVVYYNIDNAR